METGDGKDELQCFIHSVSPVKKASASEQKYFNCTLQTKENVVRAVCFSPEKQSQLHSLQKTRSPIEIKNIRKSTSNGKEDVIILKHTKISPLGKDDIDFYYDGKLEVVGLVTNISSLQNVAPEQLLSIKGQVAQISAVKVIQTQHLGKLTKQEVIIRDTTSSIKIILWQDYVNMLEPDKTYIFNNLRLKVTKYDRYLNTAKSEKFSLEECPPFENALVDVDEDLNSITSATIEAQVVGMQHASKTVCCMSCQKNVVSLPDGQLGKCESCKLVQLLKACATQWFIRMLVQNTKSLDQKVRLLFNHNDIQNLLSVLGISIDLNSCSSEDILLGIFKSTKKTFSVTYDMFSYKVNDIGTVSEK